MKESTQLSKKDCKIPMTEQESREVQIAMLDALVEFCEHHGLRYFLSGGTLLGAVRHQGFIPWDDDIDVNMPRPDCEKLFQLTNGNLGKYSLERPDEGKYMNCCNWLRIYDENTVVENYKGGVTEDYPYYHPIFLDIFPIEGFPKGKVHCVFFYARILFLDKMRVASTLEHMEAKTAAAHIFHVVSVIPAKIVGYRRWGKAIQRVVQKFSFDQHEFVGVATVTHYIAKEKVRKKDYLNSTEVIFEGKRYKAPGNYEKYLTQLYGDYMKLPPPEQQKSQHAFHMYWRS